MRVAAKDKGAVSTAGCLVGGAVQMSLPVEVDDIKHLSQGE
jgi:hypothetical protein